MLWQREDQIKLIVRKVEDTIKAKNLGKRENLLPGWLQTHTLLDTTENLSSTPVLGGTPRWRKSQTKERIFSVRDEFGQWNPKLQSPELWGFNGRITKGENVRVFPISNWTEIDVGTISGQKNIPLPSIYFFPWESHWTWRTMSLSLLSSG